MRRQAIIDVLYAPCRPACGHISSPALTHRAPGPQHRSDPGACLLQAGQRGADVTPRANHFAVLQLRDLVHDGQGSADAVLDQWCALLGQLGTCADEEHGRKVAANMYCISVLRGTSSVTLQFYPPQAFHVGAPSFPVSLSRQHLVCAGLHPSRSRLQGQPPAQAFNQSREKLFELAGRTAPDLVMVASGAWFVRA